MYLSMALSLQFFGCKVVLSIRHEVCLTGFYQGSKLLIFSVLASLFEVTPSKRWNLCSSVPDKQCRCAKAYTGSHCEKGKVLVTRTMFLKIFHARACRILLLLSHHSSSSDFTLTCFHKHNFLLHYYSFSLFFLYQLIMTAAVHQDQKENRDAK